MLTNDDFRRLLHARGPVRHSPYPQAPPQRRRVAEPAPLQRRRFPADFETEETAAHVLRQWLSEKASDATEGATSLRESGCFRGVSASRRGAIFACVCETSKHLAQLRHTLSAVPELAAVVHDDLDPSSPTLSEPSGCSKDGEWVERASGPRVRLDLSLTCVLLHDLLISRRWLDARQPRVQLLLHHQKALVAAHAGPTTRALAAAEEVVDGAGGAYLLFARVNTLRCSIEEATCELVGEGWCELRTALGTDAASSELATAAATPLDQAAAERRFFCRDALLPDVLAFAPSCGGAPLRELRLVREGGLLLQDRASCMVARVLDPEPGSTVIDACAAPGKKSAHLAALMGGRGTVRCFDVDRPRANAMRELLARLGAACVTVNACDFASVPVDSAARAILLDPSCTGSGTVFAKAAKDESPAFAAAQTALLRHALSFGEVRRVVYSTCSVHAEENEAVVAAALASPAGACWQLVHALPAWPRRGIEGAGLSPEEAAMCIRCCPRRDLCLGFFIACLDRSTDR